MTASATAEPSVRAGLVEVRRCSVLQLRAGRAEPGPRVGHPDFIGPFNPEVINRPGRIYHDSEGAAYFVVVKERWEEKRDAALLQYLEGAQ